MTEQEAKEILNRCPFMSLLTYGGNEYLGIIQNIDDAITTIYDFSKLKSDDQKIEFLSLGEEWWNTSNRMVPINVFLKHDWEIFRPTLRTLNSKEVDIKYGPYLSLKEMALKKSKRRSITLIRRM
jgi:hypothetical protein